LRVLFPDMMPPFLRDAGMERQKPMRVSEKRQYSGSRISLARDVAGIAGYTPMGAQFAIREDIIGISQLNGR
jgi:hypothetical protein